MLQIISGKFYKTDNRYHNQCKGILYSNISWSKKIETCVATIEAADCYGQIASYIISYDNQLEKPEVFTGFNLVKTGDREVIKELKIVCSFALNAFFDEEKVTIYNLCRQNSITARDENIPSGYLQRTLDLGLHATQKEIDILIQFIDRMIGLPRQIYKNIINCIDTYNKALLALENDVHLAYSMMVYCLESLSQRYDNYIPCWDDYNQNQRVRLERCFDGVDAEKINLIKEILITNDHLKLSKRFINYVSQNLDEDFFTIDTYTRKKALRRCELEQSLLNAYKIRSKYIHALESIMPQLTVASISRESDVFEMFHDTYLTFSGLQRIVRKVIMNFVNKQIMVSKEEIDWQNELPGMLNFELAPQYWIWKHEGLQPEHIIKKYEGLLKIIVSNPKELPDLRNVINKCMEFFDNTSLENKKAIYCLSKLYNSFIAEDFRSSNYEKFLADNIKLLTECCIENMVLTSLPISFDCDITWNLEECEIIINKYNNKKFDSRYIKLPSIIETIIFLQMANSYKTEEDNIEKQKEWMYNAYLNCAGNETLQKQIEKNLETLEEFNLSSIYDAFLHESEDKCK